MGGYVCTCWRAGTGAVVNTEIRINEEITVGGTSVRPTGAEAKFDPIRLNRIWSQFEQYHEVAQAAGTQGGLDLQETVE